MASTTPTTLSEQLLQNDPASSSYAVRTVDLLLQGGVEHGASDLHLQPTEQGLQLRWRIDGVLQPLVELPATARATVIARLKILADLLTYQTEAPQEGRIRNENVAVEMRVSTFPTLYGEKAVVRLFASDRKQQLSQLTDLGLPSDMVKQLSRLLAETAGALIICGPAGSGKTTTAYAALRHIQAQSSGGRNLVSLEDPVETVVAGVAQAQVNPRAEFDFARGLRSLLRQDPEVILVGEIRDRTTAEIAFQAALTGQLLLTTFHAASAAGALGRLADMGIPPYVLRSGVLAVIAQRLVRRLCRCAVTCQDPAFGLGLSVTSFQVPVGCAECRGTGYRGRAVLAEILTPQPSALGEAILRQRDVPALEALAVNAGMLPLLERARQAVIAGLTSPAEVRRVLGFGTEGSSIAAQ